MSAATTSRRTTIAPTAFAWSCRSDSNSFRRIPKRFDNSCNCQDSTAMLVSGSDGVGSHLPSYRQASTNSAGVLHA